MMNDGYFEWLCDRGGLSKSRHLAEIMDNIPFKVIVPNDTNRETDGLNLREIYCDTVHPIGNRWPREGPPSILEVLIALSERTAFLIFDPAAPSDEAVSHSVMTMILVNLGVYIYDDFRPCWTARADGKELEVTKKIRKTFEKWNDRKYFSNGKGGIFPLNRPKEDQRKVELWYQMQDYIQEKGLI